MSAFSQMFAEDTRTAVTPASSLGSRDRPSHSPVADVFFSDVNVAALQEGMRNLVFAKTAGQYAIGEQSRDELGLIMRSMYLMHARHLSFDVLGQVRALNANVLDYAVPAIISAADMQAHYLQVDLGERKLMEMPQSVKPEGGVRGLARSLGL
jgi:hypothetical protein